MTYQREREKKFVITDKTLGEAFDIISREYNLTVPLQLSTDTFWKSKAVDFVRLRKNCKELTVKVTDKGTTQDRIEENVVVEGHSMEAAARLLTLLFGPAVNTLTKAFAVFELPKFFLYGPETSREPLTISLYQVLEDRENRVFLEVEANSLETVDKVLKKLEKQFKLSKESRSLYQVFEANNG